MTNYDPIPAKTAPGGTNLSGGKELFTSVLASRPPWNEMFNRHSFKLPANLSDAIERIRMNLAYFQLNYAIIMLGVLFLGLPCHLILFIVMIGFWVFLRHEPLVIFHYTIDDDVVLAVLSVLAIVFLFFNATANIIYSLLVGAVLVLLHAVFCFSLPFIVGSIIASL